MWGPGGENPTHPTRRSVARPTPRVTPGTKINQLPARRSRTFVRRATLRAQDAIPNALRRPGAYCQTGDRGRAPRRPVTRHEWAWTAVQRRRLQSTRRRRKACAAVCPKPPVPSRRRSRTPTAGRSSAARRQSLHARRRAPLGEGAAALTEHGVDAPVPRDLARDVKSCGLPRVKTSDAQRRSNLTMALGTVARLAGPSGRTGTAKNPRARAGGSSLSGVGRGPGPALLA